MEDLNRARCAKARDILNRNPWSSWDSEQDLKECRFHCCHLSNILFHNPLVDTTHVLYPSTHLHTNYVDYIKLSIVVLGSFYRIIL